MYLKWFIVFDDEIGIDPFSPFHEQGCSKGRCVLESFKPNEVLVIGIDLAGRGGPVFGGLGQVRFDKFIQGQRL